MAYWALKTRESRDNRQDMSNDKWTNFVNESVIAIGWENIKVAPNIVDDTELKKSVKDAYHCSDKAAYISARTIRKFEKLNENDYILICRGYTPNEDNNKKVHLYGTAKDIDAFKDDRESDWWRFKHKAKIYKFGENGKGIPKKLLVKKLGKRSLLLTLQEITKEGFDSVVEWARQ